MLVPTGPDETSTAAAVAAIQLAAGAGALVTLLYVHDRRARFEATVELDAVANLHQVMMAPPEANQFAPAFPDRLRGQALKGLSAQCQELEAICPEGVQLRAVWRQGDPLQETLTFIEETGVDVVVALAAATCKSAAMRRLVRTLPHYCPCPLQTVFPPCTPVRSFDWFRRAWNRCLSAASKRVRKVEPIVE